MKRLLLIGATGLVGREVLRLALADKRVSRVIAPTRRALPPDPKLENPLPDFHDLPVSAPWWQVDAVICTLGTTIKKAGSRDEFRRIDHDLPLAFAKLARENGAEAFALNSSLGADPDSRSFYLRTKGEAERDLAELDFSSLTFVRPSVIGGNRDESRPGERVAAFLLGALRPLIPARYRVVPATRIAGALLESTLAGAPGTRTIESEAI